MSCFVLSPFLLQDRVDQLIGLLTNRPIQSRSILSDPGENWSEKFNVGASWYFAAGCSDQQKPRTGKTRSRNKFLKKGSKCLGNAVTLQSSNLQKNELSLSSSNMGSNMSCSMIRRSSYLGFNHSLARFQSFKPLMHVQMQVFLKLFI